MAAPLSCPECHIGTMSLHTDGLVGVSYPGAFHVRTAPVELRMVPRPFGSCNRCEFCVEIDTRK